MYKCTHIKTHDYKELSYAYQINRLSYTIPSYFHMLKINVFTAS